MLGKALGIKGLPTILEQTVEGSRAVATLGTAPFGMGDTQQIQPEGMAASLGLQPHGGLAKKFRLENDKGQVSEAWVTAKSLLGFHWGGPVPSLRWR